MIQTVCRDEGITLSIKNTRRLNFLFADILKNKVEHHIKNKSDKYIIDLQGIDFIDSYSFNILLQIKEMLNRRGKELYIINANESTNELFNLTGLSQVLMICNNNALKKEIA